MSNGIFTTALGIYNILISIFIKSLALFGIFSPRLKRLRQNRKNSPSLLFAQSDTDKQNIWFHCASYGEFEGILPLIKEYKQSPDYRISCSFFSASGFEPLHTHHLIDHTIYLPFDTKSNMKQLIMQLEPDCLIVSQNEYWPNMIAETLRAEIPVYYVGTYVREKHWWLQSHFKFLTKPLQEVNTIFLQDDHSKDLLKNANYSNCVVFGNPRIDQVIANKNETKDYPSVESFCQGKQLIVCGSTLLSDEKILYEAASYVTDLQFIIVPHDPEEFEPPISDSELMSQICFHSSFTEMDTDKQIMVYDSIGDLKYLYQFGSLAYVGGGFDKGVHNTLEPAVFEIPVLTGPRIEKFNHAISMQELGVLSVINGRDELIQAIQTHKNGLSETTSKKLNSFLSQNAGATRRIMNSIKF